MADDMLERLTTERAQKVEMVKSFTRLAAEEGRDLTQQEQEHIRNCQSRVGALDVQIELVSNNLEMAAETVARIKQLDPAMMQRDISYRTAGEYLWDMIHRNSHPEAATRLQKFQRSAEHIGYDKEATIPVAGGFNGLVVAPVVGAVLNPRPQGRPLFTALGVRPLTGSPFLRPRVVDPNFETGVGVRAQEKAELASKAWDIVSEQVPTTFVGGYINISEMLIDMIPSGLDMIVAQMNRRLEYATEAAAVDELAKTTDSVALAATATTSELTAALGEASARVIQNTGEHPTVIAMGPTGWGRIIGLSDLAGRPIVPPVGAVNALSSNGGGGDYFTSFFGMRAVVTHAIDDADLYLTNGYGLEVYERKHGIMQAPEPSVWGRQLAVASTLAFYRPVTAEAGAGGTPPAESNGVVKIDWA